MFKSVGTEGIQQAYYNGVQLVNEIFEREYEGGRNPDVIRAIAFSSLRQNARIINNELDRIGPDQKAKNWFVNTYRDQRFSTEVKSLQDVLCVNKKALAQLEEYKARAIKVLTDNPRTISNALFKQKTSILERSMKCMNMAVACFDFCTCGLISAATSSMEGIVVKIIGALRSSPALPYITYTNKEGTLNSLSGSVVVDIMNEGSSLNVGELIIEDKKAVLRNFNASLRVLLNANDDLQRLAEKFIEYIFQPDKIRRAQMNIQTHEFTIEYDQPVEIILGKSLGVKTKLILPQVVFINFKNDRCNFSGNLPKISKMINLADITSISFLKNGICIAVSSRFTDTVPFSNEELIGKLMEHFGEREILDGLNS